MYKYTDIYSFYDVLVAIPLTLNKCKVSDTQVAIKVHEPRIKTYWYFSCLGESQCQI